MSVSVFENIGTRSQITTREIFLFDDSIFHDREQEQHHW